MTIIMVMIEVNINEAKAKLSEYIEAVLRGQRVLICKRNQPIVELRAVAQKRALPRPIGGGPYSFDLPPSFFEPLDEVELTAWEEGAVFPKAPHAPSRVAERPEGGYGAPRARKPRR